MEIVFFLGYGTKKENIKKKIYLNIYQILEMLLFQKLILVSLFKKI